MAKDTIPSFSTTASSNTDAGGVGLTDNDSARNQRDGLQQVMRILKRTDLGETPVDDSWTFQNATDTTKKVRFDASEIPTGTTRALDAESLYQTNLRNAAPTETYYGTAGTFPHTFQTKTKYFQVDGVGSGGGGGSVDGQGTGTSAAGGGGGSGFYGYSTILAKGDLTTATVVIGAGGAGGAATGGAENGANGGNTTWSDGTNNFTWGGGRGGAGGVATTVGRSTIGGDMATGSAGLWGGSQPGSPGIAVGGSSLQAVSGNGGSTPYGSGGRGQIVFNDSDTGDDGAGRGSGGGGGATSNVTTNVAGGDGRLGFLRVLEW